LEKSKLISWLLENGADPNSKVIGKSNEYETPFSLFSKQFFLILDWRLFEEKVIKDQIFVVLLLRFFDFAGDLRTTTLLYCYEYRESTASHDWKWGISCPIYDRYLRGSLDWIVVIQVNCSWLTQGTIAKRKASECKDEEQILASKYNSVEPEFKVLQIFSQNICLADFRLENFFEDDSVIEKGGKVR